MSAAVADPIALGALKAALAGARETGEDRPALDATSLPPWGSSNKRDFVYYLPPMASWSDN